jgi:hypothetical protein
MRKPFVLLCTIAACFAATISCQGPQPTSTADDAEKAKQDSIEQVRKAEEEERKRPRTADDIELIKDLIFDKYALEDKYEYQDTFRVFQWDKIKEKLAYIENFQREHNDYGVIVNYKNKNGEAPTVSNFVRNAYKRVSDTLGTERYQSAPLYREGETSNPIIYARDGSLVKYMSSDTLDMVKIKGLTNFEGVWDIPKRYVTPIGDTTTFRHIAVVDVTNQNICTLEHSEKGWIVRSMNPATTGRHAPPYAMETPVGIFVLQEQKTKMFYTEMERKPLKVLRLGPAGLPMERIYTACLSTIPKAKLSNTAGAWERRRVRICAYGTPLRMPNLSMTGLNLILHW